MISDLLIRIRALFRRATVENELDDELRFHFEMQVEKFAQSGLSLTEARRRARLTIGGADQIKEQCREARGVHFLETLAQDIAYGFRILRKSPGFAATAVLTLALGIGANAAIFSVVNAVLLRSLPYPDPNRLLTLSNNQSLPDLEDIQTQTAASFSAIGGVNPQPLAFTGSGEPIQITSASCNAGLFEALGVRPAIGRAFTPQEDVYGGPALVILTHGFWTRHFAADPAAIGKSIQLGGQSYTIIGIMPPDFWLPGRAVDVLVSIRVSNPVAAKFRGVHFLTTYLRLRPGATINRANSELSAVDDWLASHYPEHDRDSHRHLIPLRDSIVGDVRLELMILFAAVAIVLLIACVNFASLQLARSATRRREIAIRTALGASTGRLIRQIVTECVLLSILGGLAGLILGSLGVRFLMLLKPANLPRIENTSVDAAVMSFTFALALLTGILSGLIPAFSAVFFSANLHLKHDKRSASGGTGFRLRELLVVSEIAMALVLLIGATLMLRSFATLHRVDPGFRSSNILTMRLELPESRYAEQFKQRQLHQQLLDRLNATPGMQAALVSELPMSGDFLTHNFIIDGHPLPPTGTEPEVQTRTIAGDYFRLMGIPLLAGRDFGPQDRTGSQHVAVVNRAFVAQYFPSQNPINVRVDWARSEPRDWMTIVGVVGDVKHFGPGEPEQPAVYDLYSQTPQQWKRWMYIVIRSDAPAGAVLAIAKQHLSAIDDQLPLTQVSTMNDVLAASLDRQRFNLTLLATFAIVALALAVVGIYGVMAYSVTQRTNEIGIRVALGAQARDVLRLILARGARLALIGSSLGIFVSLALTRFMSRLLFGISPDDPQTFVLIPIVLGMVALLACYIPARRAIRVDPIVALRYE
jgi:putative ABC transport system permease protein